MSKRLKISDDLSFPLDAVTHEPTGGGFRNTLSAVNVNGLIDKRGRELAASVALCE